MMKKIVLYALIICNIRLIQSNGNYLWEYTGNGSRSCCLHISNMDICNPDVPCTKNNSIDLLGIYDYISRILHMEKIATFPYAKFLNEAQAYVRKMSGLPNSLSYHHNQYRVDLKFFHELVLEHSLVKNDKNKSSTPVVTEAEKQKKQDEIFEYLVKIGLATKFKK